MLKWPKNRGNLLVIDRVAYKVFLCYPDLPFRVFHFHFIPSFKDRGQTPRQYDLRPTKLTYDSSTLLTCLNINWHLTTMHFRLLAACWEKKFGLVGAFTPHRSVQRILRYSKEVRATQRKNLSIHNEPSYLTNCVESHTHKGSSLYN